MAYIFPGQGSQAVGMGRALHDHFTVAREVFQEVDEALKQKLSKLMFDGPDSDLMLTENAQPAIMACSVAALRVMEQQVGVNTLGAIICTAGHSLGEYSALVCAGTLTLADAARLLRIRGQAMQQAVPAGRGAMAALIGMEFTAIEALCKDVAESGEICEIANDNSDQQVVISGTALGIEIGMELAKQAGAKRAVLLPVSAPFHCSLMKPAADRMAEALAAADLRDAALPVIANMTADQVQDAVTIRRLLVEQVTGMVRWRESVQAMTALGVDRFVELGHGKVLSGLVKRLAPDAALASVGTPEDFDAYANAA